MNSIEEYIKSINKPKESFNNLFSLTSMVDSIQKMNQMKYDFSGLNGVTQIAKSLTTQKNHFNTIATLSNSIATQIEYAQELQNNFALSGLTSSLRQIATQNKSISDKFAGLVMSQLSISSSLAQLAQSVTQSHLNHFNAIDIAIRGISNKYIKAVSIERNWDDFEVIEEINETISTVTNEIISDAELVTKADLENFRVLITEQLTFLVTKSKTEKARQFLFELITIISFILTLYTTRQSEINKINNEIVIEETRKGLKEIHNEFSLIINQELDKLNKTRIATTNVKLRYSPHKNSRIIGLVEEGQIITVIEIRHKYLLISYIDKNTEEPKSGFVMKKYFEKQ